MSVQIIQDHIPKGRRNRPGYKMEPRYITIHDTANTQTGADAAAHARYVKNTPNLLASWHFTVDDKIIYQHLPLNENGWHGGDGVNGAGNRQSIGIEICENRNGDRKKAEANAAWLTAKLLVDFNLPIAAVKQHYNWSGKNCPRVLRARVGGWAGFLAAVQSNLLPAIKTPIIGAPQATVAQAHPGPDLPSIARRIGIMVNGRTMDIPGYLINNVTYVPASAIIEVAKGQVTGHGDHIRIVI